MATEGPLRLKSCWTKHEGQLSWQSCKQTTSFRWFFFIPKMFFRYIWQCGIWRITSKAAALIRKRVSVLKRIPCLAKKQGQIKCLPICTGGRGSDVSWLFNKKKGGGRLWSFAVLDKPACPLANSRRTANEIYWLSEESKEGHVSFAPLFGSCFWPKMVKKKKYYNYNLLLYYLFYRKGTNYNIFLKDSAIEIHLMNVYAQPAELCT